MQTFLTYQLPMTLLAFVFCESALWLFGEKRYATQAGTALIIACLLSAIDFRIAQRVL
jgi:hypothetical protein